ncbi:UDP-glucuronosyltransferase 2B1-like [Anopheles albimanus]|uniref:UDP-glucuronosyltransferase n=1 Tax=Anopheles albimanus TaxID=7167 RepID=A0A182FHX2_ANOAL|nr:UDP-glucuronosyltransferase 2B1-like [Anopheles albimanus]
MIVSGVAWLLVSLSLAVDGANILCLMGVASPSHHIWNRSIMGALAQAGHNLTILSADVEKNQPDNVHYIHLEEIYPTLYTGPESLDLLEMANENEFASVISFYRDFVVHECAGTLKSKGLQVVLNYPENFRFDLVLHDFTCGPCLLGLLHKFNYPPLVSVTAFNNPPYSTEVIGGHKYYSYVPFYSLSYDTDMNFLQRVHNTVLGLTDLIYRNYVSNPRIDRMMRDYFPYPDLPYAPELHQRSKLMLVNAHYSIDFPETAPPNLIAVGGLQIKDPAPLPQDLEQFMNASRKGAVLFSLGTNVRSDQLGPERQRMIIEALRQLPDYHFLWKFETELDIPLPKNVIIRPWLPQNDILAHRTTRAFITHAGLLSTHEATWYGVPIVGIPFIADQHRNLERCVRKGIARRVPFQTLTTAGLKQAIVDVLEDPQYRTKMAAQSALFRDQPEKPLTRAIWWIEWVLRHPHETQLDSPVLRLGFFKTNLIDVILFLASLPIGLLLVCLRICRRKNPVKAKGDKKRN